MPAQTTRKAARSHRCESCRRTIKRGEIHLLHTTFSSDDLPSPPDNPVQTRECSDCAVLHGRGEAITARRKHEKAEATRRYRRKQKTA